MEAEIKVMIYENRDIQHDKIFKWILPTFDGESFKDFLVARMQLYMMHLMIKGWKLQWFDPNNGTMIL